MVKTGLQTSAWCVLTFLPAMTNKYFIICCLLFPFISFMILLAVCQHYHRGIFSDEWVEECCRKEVGNATTKAKEVRIYFFYTCCFDAKR